MSDEEKAGQEEEDATESIGVAEFLEDHPPNAPIAISDLAQQYRYSAGGALRWKLSTPDLQLYCSQCGGVRTFGPARTGEDLHPDRVNNLFSEYVCRNCRKETKTYSLKLALDSDSSGTGMAVKIGEEPRFGPPVPSRTISLIGPDRDLFLKGRSAESQGLGIGAYAYYRRVVEGQWERLLSEITRVARKGGASADAVAVLEAAAQEKQFSKAVEIAKDAVPESLKINGHNPLTLLYSSLSEGVHEMSDEDCLDMAAAIRVVLYELADRMSSLLKDQAELRTALTRILNRKDQ